MALERKRPGRSGVILMAICAMGATVGSSACSPSPGPTAIDSPNATLTVPPNATLTVPPGSSSPSPARGTFAVTDLMAQPAFLETATILENGQVLVTGTDGSADDCAALAQLYDPAQDSFTLLNSMAGEKTGYCSHRATALKDGRILITSDGGPAQIFDPSTRQFSSAGSMTTPRSGHGAILLADGRVLIVGGDLFSRIDATQIKHLSSAEIFDPVTRVFRPTASTPGPVEEPALVRLGDGRVLVAGGYDPSLQIYDPRSGTFRLAGRMSTGRLRPAALLLKDGRVLIAGGHTVDGSTGLDSAEVYDPATERSIPIASAAGWPRTFLRLPDGRVLTLEETDVDTMRLELFDESVLAFKPLSWLPASGSYLAVAMRDGRVLLAGNPALVYRP